MKDRQTLEIHIHNLTRAQAIAIEDLLATWQQLGSQGSSRWTGFFADGGGHVARHQHQVDGQRFWPKEGEHRGEYRIDFDAIALALRAEEEAAKHQSAALGADHEQAGSANLNLVPPIGQS